jgi:hypothetical protein
LSGFESLPECVDFFAVSPFELGKLGGQGADDTAGLVEVDCGRHARGLGLLLGAETLDALADLGAAVEKSRETPAIWPRPRNVIGTSRRIISRSPCTARVSAAALYT